MAVTVTRRNLFAVDKTENENATAIDGEAYVRRRVDPALKAEVDEIGATYAKLDKEAGLPPFLQILRVAALLGAFVILLFLVQDDYGFADGFYAKPLMYYGILACVAFWLLVSIYGGRRSRKVAAGDEVASLAATSERVYAEIKATLGYDEHTPEIDVLCPDHCRKNGKEQRANRLYAYANRVYTIFRDGDDVCFADMEKVVAVPIASLGAVTKVTANRTFDRWTKEVGPSSDRWRQYGVKEINGILNVTTFYRIAVGDDFEITLANYELERFLEVTGWKLKE